MLGFKSTQGLVPMNVHPKYEINYMNPGYFTLAAIDPKP